MGLQDIRGHEKGEDPAGDPLPAPDSPQWPRIYRVQLSAALEAPNTPDARTALTPFAEPAYLHQTRLFLDDTLLASWPDLPEALSDLPRYPSSATIRPHVHVRFVTTVPDEFFTV